MADAATTAEFEALLAYLKRTRGFDFTAYKRATLSRRIDKRVAAAGVGSYGDYTDYLEVHPDEFGELFNAILINVTTFFRDPDTFDYLRREAIPTLLASKPPDEHIRVWSAGCASGEECYSIAMLLAEALGAESYRDRVKIYATDVDEEELAMARQATYSERRMEDVPADLRDKYFDRQNGHWSFKKDFRRAVIFGRHDLLDDAPISRVDLLVCRNTLMYFNHDAQSKIVSRFHFALRDGGFLVLGKAEMLLSLNGTFTPIDLKQRVFMKLAEDRVVDRLPGAAPRRDDRAEAAGASRLREISFDQDPVAQLIVDQGGQLILANTRARDLFHLAPRDIGRPLQDLEISYRPVELRSCIDDAYARRQVVQLRGVSWPAADGEPRYFNIQVIPVFDVSDAPLGSKILFTDVTRQHDLQDQLQRSRLEVETAYEELQFLSGILRHVPVGVVVLDADLRVELWNDVSTELWGLRQDDVRGKHFLGLDIGLPLDLLRPPLLALLASANESSEVDVEATNRRGRAIHLRVQCASAAAPGEEGRGIILVMREILEP